MTLEQISEKSSTLKAKILNAEDNMQILGNVYYVSNRGNDLADGKTPETAWQTLEKVSKADLKEGDGVKFCRGDLFRGFVVTKKGVTYCAYGSGDKPKFYGWDKSLADPFLWELFDKEHNIWKLKEPILDCGTLVFNDGEAHSRKLIPSYINGQFVCRDEPLKPFVIANEMTEDLDIYCHFDSVLTTADYGGKQGFPVPAIDDTALTELYLRCDKGNPAAIYSSIEALPRRSMLQIYNNNITIDNLCLKYIGLHAIAAGTCSGLHVSNCEIGWIGGTVQNYYGHEPNFPQGGRGTVTRFGNGIEVYGGCDDYIVENCYIYQCYDCAVTHQISTNGKLFELKNIRYTENLIEHCVYSIEYFLYKNKGPDDSYIENCEMDNNILRLCGYGWGQQRHNKDTPAHIKSWNAANTVTEGFFIHDNIFDRSGYRLVHIVADTEDSLPEMRGNVYVQNMNGTLGQFGSMENGIPEMLTYDDKALETVNTLFGEPDATVIYSDSIEL